MSRRLLRADGTNLTLLASGISAVLGTGGMRAAHAQEPGGGAINDEITVTGSRIVRRDLNAPSPIMTVDSQRLEQSSTISIESVLNQMPQFVPASTQFDSGVQTGATLSLGIGSVNLRGIGTNRTLVLVDGRRAQPANAALIVDTNTIPSAAIERVETITGGASAVYGADALAGVVNFILKKDFEGVDLDFKATTTERSDGEEYRGTALMGVNSADKKGNVMLGVEWYTRENVLSRDRDFYHNGWYDPGSDAGGGFLQMAAWSPNTAVPGVPVGLPPQSVIDGIFAGTPGYTPGKVPNTSDIYFNPDGTPFVITAARGYNGPISDASTPWDQNLTTGFGGVRKIPNGDLGQIGTQQNFASTPLQRRSAFGRAHHDITDNLEAFVQANYSNVEVTTRQNYPPAITVWSAPIPNDGKRYLPAGLQTLLASRTKLVDPDGAGPLPAAPVSAANDPWTMFRVLDFLPGPNQVDTNSSVYQIMAGIDGHLPNRDWTWEAYVSTGHTQVDNVNFNTPSLQRYQSLVAQPNWGQGTFASGRNYSQTCTSGLPIFIGQGITQVTQDCIDAIDTRGKAQTRLDQNILEANVQGKIIDMKSGELRFSAGASERKNDFSYDPINDVANVTDNPVGLFASNHTNGSTEVKELYGELLVPATKKLNFELGYRYSDYKDLAVGSTDTYKALFDWGATQKMRVRGGLQRATRAPNTAELFQGPTLLVVPFAPSDPCSYTFDHGDQPGTHLTWGNTQANTTTRLQVQQLCQAIIANSDSDPTNDTTSRFGVAGTASANNFSRISPAFFPLEIEVQQGNPKVGPETADTWTLGLVLNGPGPLENLTASIDVYNIHIEDAIAPVNSLFVYQQCFNANGTSNPALAYNDPGGWCKLIKRNVSTGERAQVAALFVNSGTLETQGVDIAVNWRKGPFYINSLITYLDKYDVQDVKNGAVVHVAGTFDRDGQFDYKLNTTLGYNFTGGKAQVGLTWRYLPSVKDESASRNPATTVSGVGSYQNFGLFAGYSLNPKMQLTMGIDNLADKQPPVYGYTTADHNAEVTRADYYDILGRRYYTGIKISF
jgi:outer membrane receptor protein involved in Fe transport